MITAAKEFAFALLMTFGFIVVMPLLACGGFGLMMHGLNEANEAVFYIGMAGIPVGWIVLSILSRIDFDA